MDHPKELQQAAAEDSIRELKPHARAHLAYLLKHGQPNGVADFDQLVEFVYEAGRSAGYDAGQDGDPYTPPKQTEHAALSADELEVLP